MLHSGYWGRGYATEAGAGSVAYAFEVMGADELFSVILPDNARSQAVARRLGFTWPTSGCCPTTPQPHGIWRLGRDEWSAVRGGPARRPGRRATLNGNGAGAPQRRLSPPSTITTSPVT